MVFCAFSKHVKFCYSNHLKDVIGPGIQYLKMYWNWNSLMHALTSVLSLLTSLKKIFLTPFEMSMKILGHGWQSYSFTCHFLPVKLSKSWRNNDFLLLVLFSPEAVKMASEIIWLSRFVWKLLICIYITFLSCSVL